MHLDRFTRASSAHHPASPAPHALDERGEVEGSLA